MRNVAVIMSIVFSVCVMGFVVNFDEILRLHEGQVQVMREGEWVCADEDIRRIANSVGLAEDGTITADSITFFNTDITGWEGTAEATVDVTDDYIRQLAESGRICEALGHQWKNTVWETGTLIWTDDGAILQETKSGQECQLCGKTRIPKWEEQ